MSNSAFKGFFRFVLPDFLHPATDNPEFIERIRQAQLAELLNLLQPMALASTAGALLLCFVNLTPVNAPLLLSWFAVFIGLTFYPGVSRFLREKILRIRQPVSTNMMFANMAAQVFTSAVLWALAPVLFFPGASAEQKVFVAIATCGVMGSGAITLKAAPRLAGIFSVIVSTGLVAGLALDGSPAVVALALFTAFFFTAVMHSVNESGKLFAESLVKQYEMEKSKDLFSMLFRDFEDSSSDWMWEVNASGLISHVSPGFFRDPRAAGFEMQGKVLRQSLKDPSVPAALRKAGRMPRALLEAFLRRMPFKDIVVAVEIRGQWRYWRLSGRPVYDAHGSFQGMRGACTDISEAQEAENRIQYLAMHDPLTGLANRENFAVRFNSALAGANAASQVALLTMDLDKFKVVNDTLGHQAGDQVLAAVSKRLLAVLPEGALAARIGGDEFSIMLTGADAEARAISLSESVIAAINEPVEIDLGEAEIGCSIGVAIAPRDGHAAEALHRNADLALYRAKTEPRSAYRIFEPNMDAAARKRQELEFELRSAIKRDEFELYFQPLANAVSTQITGYETLLRWNSEKFGRVPPDEFIRIAEKSGLINEIGEWVLRQACKEAVRWGNDISVAINLSPRQMNGFRILDVVASALSESGLLPHRLELEITESTLEADPDHVAGLLRSLRALGCRISLDDFGTGYSSLSYLVRFPIDKLKIDKSFIQSAIMSEQNLAIIRAIVSLARAMGVKLTAEGVETEDQHRLVIREGIDEIQGYLISRPRPSAHVAAMESNLGQRRLVG